MPYLKNNSVSTGRIFSLPIICMAVFCSVLMRGLARCRSLWLSSRHLLVLLTLFAVSSCGDETPTWQWRDDAQGEYIAAVQFRQFAVDAHTQLSTMAQQPVLHQGLAPTITLQAAQPSATSRLGMQFTGYVLVLDAADYQLRAQGSGEFKLLLNDRDASSAQPLTPGWHKIELWQLTDDASITTQLQLVRQQNPARDLRPSVRDLKTGLFTPAAAVKTLAAATPSSQPQSSGWSYRYLEVSSHGAAPITRAIQWQDFSDARVPAAPQIAAQVASQPEHHLGVNSTASPVTPETSADHHSPHSPSSTPEQNSQQGSVYLLKTGHSTELDPQIRQQSTDYAIEWQGYAVLAKPQLLSIKLQSAQPYQLWLNGKLLMQNQWHTEGGAQVITVLAEAGSAQFILRSLGPVSSTVAATTGSSTAVSSTAVSSTALASTTASPTASAHQVVLQLAQNAVDEVPVWQTPQAFGIQAAVPAKEPRLRAEQAADANTPVAGLVRGFNYRIYRLNALDWPVLVPSSSAVAMLPSVSLPAPSQPVPQASAPMQSATTSATQAAAVSEPLLTTAPPLVPALQSLLQQRLPALAGSATQLAEIPLQRIPAPFLLVVDSIAPIPTAGYYTFYNQGATPGWLSIANAYFPFVTPVSVYLEQGQYRVSLQMVIPNASSSLDIRHVMPGQPRRAIDQAAVQHTKRNDVTDFDGDQVPDAQDAYPEDASRVHPDVQLQLQTQTLLAAQFTTALRQQFPAQSMAAQLQWQASGAAVTDIKQWQLQRRRWPSETAWQAVTMVSADGRSTSLESRMQFDLTVTNGVWYQYRLQALDGQNRTLGEAISSPLWVAYNQDQVQQLRLSSLNSEVTLNGSLPAADAGQQQQLFIWRTLAGRQQWQLMSSNASLPWRDNAILPGASYQYRTMIRNRWPHPAPTDGAPAWLERDGPVLESGVFQVPEMLQLQLFQASNQPDPQLPIDDVLPLGGNLTGGNLADANALDAGSIHVAAQATQDSKPILALPQADGSVVYQYRVAAHAEVLALRGRVSAAVGPIRIEARPVSAAQNLVQQLEMLRQGVRTDWQWAFQLPKQDAQWQLTAFSSLDNKQQRSEAITLQVLVDNKAPTIVLDREDIITDAPSVQLSGQIQDEHAGTQLQWKMADGSWQNIDLSAERRFQINVPLNWGTTLVVLRATDAVGNSVERRVELRRQTGISFSLEAQQQHVLLRWPTLPDVSTVRIERQQWQPAGWPAQWQTLLELPSTQLQHIDTTVQNGQLYRYRLVAAGNTSADSRIFISYVDGNLSGLSLQSQDQSISIQAQWPALTAGQQGQAVTVWRQQGDGAWQLWQDNASLPLQDSSVSAQQRYRYRLQLKQWWQEPNQGQRIEKQAPALETDALLVPAALRLVLSHSDAVNGDEQVFYVGPQQTQLALQGELQGAVGQSQLLLNGSVVGEPIAAETSAWQLALPLATELAEQRWQLRARSSDSTATRKQQSNTLAILVLRDATAPQLILDQTDFTTAQGLVTLSGQVTDERAAAQSALRLEWQAANGDWTAIALGERGLFSLPVTLGWGENVLQLRARDAVGNTSVQQIRIVRQHQFVITAEQTQPQLQQVSISWPTLADVSQLRIERRQADTAQWQPLTDAAAAPGRYIDSSVDNGTLYYYRATALGQGTPAATAGTSPERAVFVAVNTQTVQNLALTSQNTDISVDGQLPALQAGQIGQQLSLWRQQGNGPAWQLLSNDARLPYQDSNISPEQDYRYRAMLQQHWLHPLTQQLITRDGPMVESATLTLPSQLQLSLLQADGEIEGRYQYSIHKGQTALTLRGRISGALGAVQLIARKGELQQQFNLQNGDFTVQLSIAGANSGAGSWQWQAHSGDANTPSRVQRQQHSNVVTAELRYDDVIPSIKLDQQDLRTGLSSFTLSGQVLDNQSLQGARLQLSMPAVNRNTASDSNTATVVEIPLQLDAQGLSASFSTLVPLSSDLTKVLLIATDRSGNVQQLPLEITRTISDAAEFSITSHSDGQVVADATIELSGELSSPVLPEQLSLTLLGQTARISPLRDQRYRFVFDQVPLVPGDNRLSVQLQGPGYQKQQAITLTYVAPVAGEKPKIVLYSPQNGGFINARDTVMTGEIRSSLPVTLRIGDAMVHLQRRNSLSYVFSHALRLDSDAAQVQNGMAEHQLTLIAENAAGLDEMNVRLRQDAQAPTIQLFDGIQPAPAVKPMLQSPIQLRGEITEAGGVTLLVNEQVVLLERGMQDGRYLFSTSLAIPKQQASTVQLKAIDLAGNQTTTTVILQNLASASIRVLQPTAGQTFTTDGSHFTLPVIAELSHALDNPVVKLWLDGQLQQELPLATALLNTTVSLPVREGEHRLRIELLDGVDGSLKATTEQPFHLQALASVPLQVVKTQPVAFAEHIDRNQPIAFYFNKAIDRAKLKVEVTQTVQGKDYQMQGEAGASMLEQPGERLVDVSKDHEPVAGELSVLPGDHSWSFYPSANFSYGANVKVSIAYDGAELQRFSFKVRALPTLLDGGVADPFDSKLMGIKVSLPEVGRHEVTSDGGTFAFGYLDSGERNLQGGDYLLELNSGAENPNYGNLRRYISLSEGRQNSVGMLRLMPVNKEVPFVNLRSRGGQVIAANGDVELDLSHANLQFPDSQFGQRVQFSLLPMESIGMRQRNNLAAIWAYAAIPQGISVQGQLPLRLKAPRLYGGLEYLPADGERLLLVGRAARADELVPVGVVRRQGEWLVSEGAVQLHNLDYLAVSRVHFSMTPLLADYADGKIDLTAIQAAMMVKQ